MVPWLCEQSLGARAAAWQQSAACREADRHHDREGANVCVCVRVCRGRDGVPVCVCMRLLHSCDSERCPGRRSPCSSSPQPPDTRPEVMAVTFSQDLSASQPPCLDGRGAGPWLGVCHLPPLAPSSHGTEGSRAAFLTCPERGTLEAAGALLGSCFMTLEAGVDQCCSDMATWPGFFLILKSPATGSSRPLLRHLGLSTRL